MTQEINKIVISTIKTRQENKKEKNEERKELASSNYSFKIIGFFSNSALIYEKANRNCDQ